MMTIPKLQIYALPEPHDTPQNKVDQVSGPQRAALLIHDMQGYPINFWGENCPMMEQVITNTVVLRDYYKQYNIPIYYTTRSREQSDEDRTLLNGMWRPGLTRLLEQQKVVDRLAPDTDDAVLVRWRYSAFHRSPLEQILRENGRSQLITTGIYAYIGYMTTATDAFTRDIKPFMVTDMLTDFSRDEHLISLGYVAGRSGRVVMTEGLLLAPIPASEAELREVILPSLGKSDEPFDNDNLIGCGLDSVCIMALAARQRKVHGDIDFVTLAKNLTIDAWWKLLSRKVK